MFVYNNSLLLMGSVMNILFSILTSMIGVICLGAGIIGYVLKKTPAHERFLLFAAAFLLIKPGLITDLIGFSCAVLTIVFQLKKRSESTTDRAPA
jgi:TRAP-type uncharacterized transport system fused permease subunit